jgi:uncharacterized protein (TIGR00369 family)
MIFDEPVRGGYPDPRRLGLTGLRQMEVFLERGGPRPPIAHLTGIRPTTFGDGTSDFEMPVSPWFASSPGVVQGGIYLVLADAPLGTAIHTKLPAGVTYTTSEISMYFLRPVHPSSGSTITASARAIQVGRSLALSEVSLTDDTGRLVAHGSSRCFVFPPLDPVPDPPADLPAHDEPVYETPDPYLRPVEGAGVLPQETWDSMSGLEILRAQMAGDLPSSPIAELTGMRVIDATEGSATLAIRASEWLCSPTTLVQGGATACAADVGLACAVLTTLPRSTAFAPLDIKTNFLRPVTAGGNDLLVKARVLHRGKSLAVAEAEVLNARGKQVMLASGTSQILPSRPASII